MVRPLGQILSAALFCSLLRAQTLHTEEGYLLPARDTVYVLVVFAEVDYTECGEDPHERQYGNAWGRTADGRTRIPLDADSLLDPFLSPHQAPTGIITRTYAEASFGALMILGDYYPEVLRVSCQRLPPGGTHSLSSEVELVLEALQEKPFRTAHELPWTVFDRWTLLPQRAGLPKKRSDPLSPSPRLDVLFIIWRNLAYRLDIQKPPFPCNYGFGLWSCDVRKSWGPFTGGVETASSYTTCGTAQTAAVGFLAEFFHGLYGGNHWHTAGGAGWHTFPFLPVCRGLSTQGSRPIYAIGYDRWLMGWKAPDKAHLISALDEREWEIPTDMVMPSRPETLRIWLRDFMTSGDAVRIRLPYTEYGGPLVKNQYLWLENRRFIARSEVWGASYRTSCESVPPSSLRGFPGLYAYIQVGKDKKEGKDIYYADPAHPNGLGSWIFWLPADGRYDPAFRETQKGWALDRSRSRPNPLTGIHDFYLAYDADKDGKVHPTREGADLGILEWRGDSVCTSWYGWGDSGDAFQAGDVLSIESNPAPLPVYTLISEEGYRGPARSHPAPYDNRIIWLNGLRIAILRERKDGALLVEIMWDYFTIRRSVRWCGEVRLRPHPYKVGSPSLIVKGTLLLDRSDSPTYGQALTYDSFRQKYWYSDTTRLWVDSGAYLRIEKGGRVILRAGSQLCLAAGARVEGSGFIEVEPGGKIILMPGASCRVPVRQRHRPWPIFSE